MQVEGQGGRVSRSGNWARGDKNGERKDEGGTGMADTDVCQEYTEVPGTSKLLLCQVRFTPGWKSTEWT